MRSKEEIDNAFEYAKRVGVKLIVGVPNYELLPYVDQKVKEYDFKYAIHLHGPDMPLYPDADDVWDHVKDLDPRIGMCLDIGHDTRNGQRPGTGSQKIPVARVRYSHQRRNSPHQTRIFGRIGRGIIDFPAFCKSASRSGL